MGMDPVTGAIVGNVAGAAVGGMFGNKAAKYQGAADRYAVDAQMAPFRLKQPFLQDLYSGGQGALNDALATGAFTGSTYAGLDQMQMRGVTGMGAFGDRAMGLGSSFMDTGSGFAQNAQDIFNRTQGRTLDDAVNYATSSPQAQAMVDAAMRDSTRQLQEQTLPGIGIGASATNNTNSSRAGVAEAIAERSYNDRRADVASDVGRNLTNQYLTSNQNDFGMAMRANQGLADVFGMGRSLVPAGAEALANAGGMLQMNDQGQLDADRDQFVRDRDFAMGQLSNMNTLLGGLGQIGQVRPSTANPYTSMMSGAMMGAGFGGNIADYFSQPSPLTANRGPSFINAPAYQGYGYTRGR